MTAPGYVTGSSTTVAIPNTSDHKNDATDGKKSENTKSPRLSLSHVKNVILEKAPCVLGEFMGTALLVCLGCMGCIEGFSAGAPSSLQLSISFGMIISSLIHIFGPISGAHFNPAITLAGLFWRKTTPILGGFYVLAQLLGGWLGFGLLRVLTPAAIMYPNGMNATGLCSTVPNPSISIIQAFIVEFLITSILILLTCACWDPLNARNSDGIPLKFGFTIAAISMLAGPFTGASMNPARSLGPAIWNNDWSGHWIYWIAPMLSGVICTLMYRAIFLKASPKKPRVDAMEEFPLSNREKNGA